MPSLFDQLCATANTALLGVFGDAVTIDGVAGYAVVMPDTDLSMGGGVQLINGARLMLCQADFPAVTVNSEVTYAGSEFIITELDDVDSAGVRQARMARA
jgi:hypothetical protein